LIEIMASMELEGNTELFHSQHGTAYADLCNGDHCECYPVRSSLFRQFLQQEFYEQTDGAPNSNAMRTALDILEARARFKGRVFIRGLLVIRGPVESNYVTWMPRPQNHASPASKANIWPSFMPTLW
jgi:hypothetical protein